MFQPGWVWLVGAGPGDPGLLTLHGLNALRQADVIVHDALIAPELLDWAPQARRIDMGKRAGRHSARQDEICAALIDLARQGLRVLRLKGGDPFVFGRGGEEAQALAAEGLPFRLIPGITAGIGGLAAAGIPVTHRDVNQSVTFVTGHDRRGTAPAALNWRAIAEGSQMLVIYMGLGQARTIAQNLLQAGRPGTEPCAVVASATLPGQTVLETTLARLADDLDAAGIAPPALLCVGRNVALRASLDWQAMGRAMALAAE